MGEVKLQWPDRVEPVQFNKLFLQRMLNNVAIGRYRYGLNDRKSGTPRQWIKRARAELRAYTRSGNWEHLVNAANYLMCETISPEHRKHHFKHETKSASRDSVGRRDRFQFE